MQLIYPSKVDSATGSASTLFIDGKGFVTRLIQQKTSKPATRNTIFVTLRPNFNVQPSTTISILGLAGASQVQAGPLIQLQPAGNAFGSSPHEGHGGWIDTEFGLRLFVRETLVAATDTVFSFDIINPTDGQASPQVSMQTDILIIAPQAMTQQPTLLSVDDREFGAAHIRQSSCFSAATNTITAQFSINFDLTSESVDLSHVVLSISGLVSGSSSSPATADEFRMVETTWAGADDVSLQFKRFGEWNEHVGVMRLYPALPSYGLVSDFPYSVSWDIVNPSHAQNPPNPAAVSIKLSYTDHEHIQREIGQAMTMASEPLSFLGSVSGDAFPLKVYGMQFMFLAIGQSSPWPAAQNVITLTMVASIDIVYPSCITLSGLAGASEPTSAAEIGLPSYGVLTHSGLISPSGNSAFESPIADIASWDLDTGTLV